MKYSKKLQIVLKYYYDNKNNQSGVYDSFIKKYYSKEEIGKEDCKELTRKIKNDGYLTEYEGVVCYEEFYKIKAEGILFYEKGGYYSFKRFIKIYIINGIANLIKWIIKGIIASFIIGYILHILTIN